MEAQEAETAEHLVSYLAEHQWNPVEIVHDQYMLVVNPVWRRPDASFILSRRCQGDEWELIAEGQTEHGTLVDQQGRDLTLTPYTTDLIDEMLAATAD